MMVPWTDERVARLKAMWHAGKSGAQIAAELGNVTRSAVIAKINRLGLSGSGRANSGLVEARRKARPKAGKPESQKPGKSVASARLPVEAAPLPAPIDDAQIPLGQRRSIDELDGRCCHWPVGDPGTPGFFFCGAPRRAVDAYCPAHMRRAHAPTPPLKFGSVKHYARR